MMDASAIKEIIKPAMAAQAAGHETDIPVAMLPEDYVIQSLEPYLDQPARHRALFTTYQLGSFIDYIKDKDNDTTVVYVNDLSMKATAIFDHGTEEEPNWATHRAVFSPKHTDAYAALTGKNKAPMEQQDFIDFIEDWAPNIGFADSEGEDIPVPKALAAVRRLHITAKRQATTEVGDFSKSHSALESVEITTDGNLPAEMRFTCEPYPGFEPRQFSCRLYARTGGDDPKLVYRITGLERMSQQIADEMVGSITAGTDAIAIYIGTIQHG